MNLNKWLWEHKLHGLDRWQDTWRRFFYQYFPRKTKDKGCYKILHLLVIVLQAQGSSGTNFKITSSLVNIPKLGSRMAGLECNLRDEYLLTSIRWRLKLTLWVKAFLRDARGMGKRDRNRFHILHVVLRLSYVDKRSGTRRT